MFPFAQLLLGLSKNMFYVLVWEVRVSDEVKLMGETDESIYIRCLIMFLLFIDFVLVDDLF